MKNTITLGQILITRNAMGVVSPSEAIDALMRHMSGDWGDVCEEDRSSNEYAVANGLRVFSVYHTETGAKFWVITEWDRSATTILLPEDY